MRSGDGSEASADGSSPSSSRFSSLDRLTTLARHWQRGGDPTRASGVLALAGDAKAAEGSFSEAAAWYSAAAATLRASFKEGVVSFETRRSGADEGVVDLETPRTRVLALAEWTVLESEARCARGVGAAEKREGRGGTDARPPRARRRHSAAGRPRTRVTKRSETPSRPIVSVSSGKRRRRRSRRRALERRLAMFRKPSPPREGSRDRTRPARGGPERERWRRRRRRRVAARGDGAFVLKRRSGVLAPAARLRPTRALRPLLPLRPTSRFSPSAQSSFPLRPPPPGRPRVAPRRGALAERTGARGRIIPRKRRSSRRTRGARRRARRGATRGCDETPEDGDEGGTKRRCFYY